MVTASSVDNLTFGQTSTDFRTLELFLSGGYQLGAHDHGGYFLDTFAVRKAGPGGDLGDAYLSVPVPGARDRLALTLGQFSPMLFQYDPINSLTQAKPAALAVAVDAFALTDVVPGVRLDYFDGRGKGTANGNYVSLGMPMQGHLSFTNDPGLTGSRGVFAQLFHRQGYLSFGGFAYKHGGSHREALIATGSLGQKIFLTGVGNVGHDALGGHRDLSLEAEYLPTQYLALTGRLEAMGGPKNDFYPVAAVTYYPFHQHLIRLLAQTSQGRGNHNVSLFIFAQL